ncbi:hypothetical protein FGO68_gene1138 [Halteria grandinella]|uniref:Uncharacterized protein n=1 Tax=Halteria grandinella TaxID=5974 RepID=A0A8J8NLV9_HALGN|nr:hypothetical protein FGO68_gene1138 [Halteria grandinella]
MPKLLSISLTSSAFTPLYFKAILFNGLISLLTIVCCIYLFFDRPQTYYSSYWSHFELIALSSFYSIYTASILYTKRDDEEWRGTFKVTQTRNQSYVYFFFGVISSCLVVAANMQIQRLGMELRYSRLDDDFKLFQNLQLLLLIGGIFFERFSICLIEAAQATQNCFLCSCPFIILSFVTVLGKYLVWPLVAFSTLTFGFNHLLEHQERNPSAAGAFQLALCVLMLIQLAIQSVCTFHTQQGIFVKNDEEYWIDKNSSVKYKKVIDEEK